MIRAVQPSELGWLVSLADQFSQEYMGKPVDYTTIKRTMKQVIDYGVALRSDHGAIVGMLLPDPYYKGTLLVELGWFSKDRYGLQLLTAFEKAGAELGATSIRMTTLHNSPPAASHILERRGYKPLDHSWGLDIGDH